ncbi:hypothetical protein BpHYR1_000542 [Brachionus plicatilis]|uniref:Uncharacterized protein n=1 Tax=Brachionus plicatilis TaxID=10195 RepID=A0A3M7PJ47_BRAPC|nr:hypothetical protein BpHYR1_000542 [Brachionus plicatilis]
MTYFEEKKIYKKLIKRFWKSVIGNKNGADYSHSKEKVKEKLENFKQSFELIKYLIASPLSSRFTHYVLKNGQVVCREDDHSDPEFPLKQKHCNK